MNISTPASPAPRHSNRDCPSPLPAPAFPAAPSPWPRVIGQEEAAAALMLSLRIATQRHLGGLPLMPLLLHPAHAGSGASMLAREAAAANGLPMMEHSLTSFMNRNAHNGRNIEDLVHLFVQQHGAPSQVPGVIVVDCAGVTAETVAGEQALNELAALPRLQALLISERGRQASHNPSRQFLLIAIAPPRPPAREPLGFSSEHGSSVPEGAGEHPANALVSPSFANAFAASIALAALGVDDLDRIARLPGSVVGAELACLRAQRVHLELDDSAYRALALLALASRRGVHGFAAPLARLCQAIIRVEPEVAAGCRAVRAGIDGEVVAGRALPRLVESFAMAPARPRRKGRTNTGKGVIHRTPRSPASPSDVRLAARQDLATIMR